MDQLYFISTLLPLLGLCISFSLVIFLIRKKIHFGLSLLVGSVLLGIFSLGKIEVFDIFKAISKAVVFDIDTGHFSSETIELAILMIIIFMLAKTMKDIGAIDRLITSLKTIFSHTIIIGIIPAIYGLMPVPGGALFSAPMVDKEGEKLYLNKDQRNFINVWFRHIWFPIYPISSAMILICSKDFTGLSYDIELYKIILANIPSFIIFVLMGSIFLKMFIVRSHEEKKTEDKDYDGLVFLLIPTIPIIFYIVLYGINNAYHFVDVQHFQKTVFIIGLLFSFLFLFIFSKISFKKYVSIVKKSLSFNIASSIFGIMIFREMFEVTQVNGILAEIIQNLPFHPLFIIIFIPLLLGLITGYNLGAIALSYVVIQPFFGFTDISIIGLTSIIFMSSFVGYLISPIHLCNVVSSDHFKTDTTRMYKRYIPSVIVLLVVQTLFVYMFYRT